MVRPELVTRKLSQLHRYLSELEAHRGLPYQDYLSKSDKRRAVERLLELVVEVAVDLNTHLVTEKRGSPPSDYADSFRAAAACGILPAGLAETLAPSAGLRNVLVHEYGEIDDAKVHGSITMALDGFAEYSRNIVKWLKSENG
ncbi:MAG: type VII toxin-antitoxin system HepT family RNase toxin [Actinomycetota bacterium]